MGMKDCTADCKDPCRRVRRLSKRHRRKLGMTYRCSAAPFKNECCQNGTVHSDQCNMCLAGKVLSFGMADCTNDCKAGCRRREVQKPRELSEDMRRHLGMTFRCSAAPFKNECCANGTVHSDQCNMCLAAKVLTFGTKDCTADCKVGCRRMVQKPRKLSLEVRRHLGMTYRCSAAPFKNECCQNGTVHSDQCNMCLAGKVLSFGMADCTNDCKAPSRRRNSDLPRELSRKQKRKL